MDEENLDYLNYIAKRMHAYDEVRLDVIEYILTQNIKNTELATNLFIVGFLHRASIRGEVLTEDELTMLLHSDDDEENLYGYDLNRTFTLDPSQENLEFTELLDHTVKTFYEC